MEKASIRVEKVSATDVVFHLEAHDRDVCEHDCTFRLKRHVDVHDSRAVNNTEVIFEHPVTWSGMHAEIPVSLGDYEVYSYKGAQIDVRIQMELHVNDALIFDTKIEGEYDLPLTNRPRVSGNAEHIIEPYDIYSFFDNFSAIPSRNKITIFVLLGLVTLAVLGAVAIALTKGELFLILFILTIGLLAASLVMKLVKNQLRGYLEVDEGPHMHPVVPRRPVPLDDLFAAHALVDLHELTVRVVAVNLECGQYRRGSGTNTRTVSFRTPVRGLILYENTLENVIAGDDVASHLRGEFVHFDEMFEYLYPPNRISRNHGLELRWEVQLLHDNYVDHELIGSNDVFDYRHFLLDDLDSDEPEDQVIW